MTKIARIAPGAWALVALSAVIWLAYFHMGSRLGLYQDDVFMYHIVSTTRDGVLREAFDLARGYGGEGRPATQVVMVLFTWLGIQLGGVTGLYVLCWILLTILGIAVFLSLRHLFSPATSFLAAALYVLFPADAAKFFAVAYMGIFGAIVFWTSVLLLLRGRTALSAVVLASIFLMGEAYILVGFLLPLLLLGDARRERRDAVRRSLRFVAMYAALMIPAIVLRLVYAPGRASGAFAHDDKVTLAKKVLASMYFGVKASAASFVERTAEFLSTGNTMAWTVAVVAFAALLAGLQRVSAASPASLQALPEARALRLGYVVLFGLLAWAASYPLYGLYPARFPPTLLLGKGSNVHAQAAIGMTFLVAAAIHAVSLRAAGRPAWLRAGAVAALVYFATLAGFFAGVQQRYADSWHFQLSFFRELPRAVPALGPDSLVVIEGVGDENTRLEGGSPFDWTLPYLFQFMWRIPSSWPSGPLIIPKGFFDATAREENGRVIIAGYPTLSARSFAAGDVVRLKVQGGRLFAPRAGAGAEADHGYSLFDESSSAPVRFAPGPFQLRAAGRGSESIVVPNAYTASDWRNGISTPGGKPGSSFYFLIHAADANPVAVGTVVNFHGAGRARVLQVDVQRQGGSFAVFVRVDRELDPDRDGYPHGVRVLPP